MPVLRSQQIARPALTAPRGSLLDTATVQAAENQWMTLQGLWQTLNCSTVNTSYADDCVIPGDPAVKEFEVPTWIDGFRFAAYKGTKCGAMSSSLDEIGTLNTEAFLHNESTYVELVFGQHVLDDAGTEDLTPTAGSVTVKQGLALIEGHAALHYAGSPTVHASGQVFSLMDSDGVTIDLSGSTFLTKGGSKVVRGGGYFGLDKGTPELEDNEAWLFATGEVALLRSEQISQKQFSKITVEDDEENVILEPNDIAALTERIYVAGFDCYAVAVKVKVF